jgi:septum formation protein
MLDAAGVEYESAKPAVDEERFKAVLSNGCEIASQLAAAKALSVHSQEWVIGSDSVVQVGEHLFSKPANRDEAARHLRYFSGKTMLLTSAVALSRQGTVDWSCTQTAKLHVRTLSDTFIKAYLDAEWPAVGYTVGAFRLESRGVQLFSSIEGDHFTILGMPLIPLLAALRERELLLA